MEKIYTRVNHNLPTKLVQRIREYADELGMPVTQVYVFLLNNALDYKDTMSQLPNLVSCFNSLNNLQPLIRNDIEK